MEFMKGIRCRQKVLDRVMDGRVKGSRCKTDEEACDICARR